MTRSSFAAAAPAQSGRAISPAARDVRRVMVRFPILADRAAESSGAKPLSTRIKAPSPPRQHDRDLLMGETVTRGRNALPEPPSDECKRPTTRPTSRSFPSVGRGLLHAGADATEHRRTAAGRYRAAERD